MSTLALAVAIVAPIISGGSGPPPITVPTIEPAPVLRTYEARTPAPGPERVVQVPGGYELHMELAPVAVVPKPPPAPVAPTRHAAGFVPGNPGADTIARAKAAPNGQLPRDALCPIWDGTLFRCDMAAALASAANAGMPMVAMTDGYRSYADQVSVKASRGTWAATPGTSNHGYGTAADVPEPARSWLFRHGADHGLINPAWAKNPNRLERWHWELAS